jgi:ABC-type antimicrobial peptide transport system permease subunit
MIWDVRVAPRDLVREAIAALLAHRLRAALSAIGIVVGIATVVTALAIGEGARSAALSEIGALGIENVFVRATTPPPASDRRRRPAAPVLSLADVAVIADTLPPGTAIAAARIARVEATAGSRRAMIALAGVTVSWRDIADPQLAAGRWLTPDDERTHRRVAVAGGRLARELFGGATPIGSRIRAGVTWYYVVGVLREKSASAAPPAMLGLDTDRSLLVPLSAADASLGDGDQPDRVQEISVRARGAGDVERTATVVAALLGRRHPGASRYELIVPRELLLARLRAQRTFNGVLAGIGALALLISGVGIMNIMLASVAARVQEIGVRRAFGARRHEIIAQFAIEAATLCVAGGAAGLPLGVLLSWIVAMAAGWPVSVSPFAVMAALILATGVGLLFGVYPARVAAAVDPIEALRSV